MIKYEYKQNVIKLPSDHNPNLNFSFNCDNDLFECEINLIIIKMKIQFLTEH